MGTVIMEELEYRQYLLNNLIIQIGEKLNICSREFFIIKYDLSLKEIKHIDHTFKKLVSNNLSDYAIFKKEIQKGIPRFSSDDVFQLLLESYELHQPFAQEILKNKKV